jgi:glycosyltransferase involved in cell wall biosynthesis
VIVPVRNCEPHIGDQMAALANQVYPRAWELLVVDNGCTDRSIEIVESWRDRLPRLEVVDASGRRGLNHARNAGVAAARGDFVAFCDADDAVAPGWLAAMADGATRADIVGGEIELAALNTDLNHAWERPTPLGGLPLSGEVVPYPPGGNCGVWTNVARELGWDEAFRFGSSDMEFGWRAHLAGFQAEFVPEAVIRLRLRRTLPALVRQHFRYGVSEPHLYRRYRGHGMLRSSTAEARKAWRWSAENVRMLARSRAERGLWLSLTATRFGRLCGSLRWGVLYL